METKHINHILFLCVMFLFTLLSSCTEEMLNQSGGRQITVNATIPGADTQANSTRVSFTQSDGSYNLVARWQEDDQIQLYVKQDKKIYTLAPTKVQNISQDGKSCTFAFQLPSDVDAARPYTIYGLHDVEGMIADDVVLAKSQLRRVFWSNGGKAVAPMWFQSTGGASSIYAQFKHLGTYEVLHLKNTSKVGVMFRHRGFDVDVPWFKVYENTPLTDDYDPTQYVTEPGDAESANHFVGAGTTARILSWYIPSGGGINNAKMLAAIDSKQVISSNAKSSKVKLQRGHAYHMYATWDGKELKFDQGDALWGELQLSTYSVQIPMGGDVEIQILNGSKQKANLKFDIPDDVVTGPTFTGNASFKLHANKVGRTSVTVTDEVEKLKAVIEVEVFKEVVLVQTETITIPGTNVSFKMIGVEGGTFWMGSPDDDREAGSDEKPRHQVKLSSFAIGETEVTQVLWKAVMGSNPSSHQGANLPVEQISRDDCSVFISKLNRLTGRNFRLPTEAEWEYAARGGKNSKGYKYAGGNDIYTVAWYGNNSDGETHPVAQRQPNELGLYDMSGNVWEIVQDYYDTNYYSISSANNPCNTTPSNLYAMRGGGCSNISSFCRVTFRAEQVLLDETQTPVDSNWDIGFRLVMSDNDTPQAYLTCPDDHHPHLIDLGLPSGTKWACCNVGADKPEAYGDYFAWGETQTKNVYNQNSSIANIINCNNEDLNISGTGYDAARVNWGTPWQMPTLDVFKELQNNTTCEWTTLNGVNGTRITGSNGGFIFLPASGRKTGEESKSMGTWGAYWVSSINWWIIAQCDCFHFSSSIELEPSINFGYDGLPIRPVICPNGKPDNDVGGSPGNGDGTSGGSDPTHDEYDDF